MIQTFLEHYQSPYTTITILKGMDGFKTIVKIKDILKSHNRLALILLQQFTNSLAYELRLYSFNASHLIGQTLVFTYSKPRLGRV